MSTLVVPPENVRKSLAEAVEMYRQQLSGSPGEEYMIQHRGLTREVLDSFQIGFVNDPMMGDDIYRGMIAIPFITKSGPVAIQYRVVGDSAGKRFLNRGSTQRMYNPTVLLSPHRRVYLCEGCIDTMTIASLGLPAIGIPGVSQWLPVFARAFRNRKLVVLADGDDKGQGADFAGRVVMDVEDADIILFEGDDVNSYRMKYGTEKLKEKLGGR